MRCNDATGVVRERPFRAAARSGLKAVSTAARQWLGTAAESRFP